VFSFSRESEVEFGKLLTQNPKQNSNLVKLVNVAYEEISVASRYFGVCNVYHVLQTTDSDKLSQLSAQH